MLFVCVRLTRPPHQYRHLATATAVLEGRRQRCHNYRHFQNRSKLVPFLEAFQSDKGEEQFNDEKRLLIETLVALEKPGGGSGGDVGAGDVKVAAGGLS